MKKYVTKQRNALMDMLEAHADETLSAEMIHSLIADDTVSLSAVYRNLSELENEGRVQRIVRPGSRSVLFRCIGEKRCKEKIHLSCSECGKTEHLSDETAAGLVEFVKNNSGFALDKNETVLYGICGDCKKSRRREK